MIAAEIEAAHWRERVYGADTMNTLVDWEENNWAIICSKNIVTHDIHSLSESLLCFTCLARKLDSENRRVTFALVGLGAGLRRVRDDTERSSTTVEDASVDAAIASVLSESEKKWISSLK